MIVMRAKKEQRNNVPRNRNYPVYDTFGDNMQPGAYSHLYATPMRARVILLHVLFITIVVGITTITASSASHGPVHGKATKIVVDAGEECLQFREAPEAGSFDPECMCESVGQYGRLGNRLTSALHLIGEAEKLFCGVDLPHDFLDGWNPPHQRWNHVNKDSFNDTCVRRTEEDWFRHTSSSPKCHLQLFRKYFSVNQTHSLGKVCPSTEHVALHVRSGDITAGDWSEHGTFSPVATIHQLYGLFPTAYYMSVIRNVRARRGGAVNFIVFCETITNPTCEFFEKLSYMDNRVSLRVRTPLLDDLVLLLCASETAASNGSFHVSFDFSVVRRVTHSFSHTPISATKCGVARAEGLSTILHWIASTKEANKFTNLTKLWNNTGFQRHEVNAAFVMNHAEVSC